MSRNVMINEDILSDIADSIRNKTKEVGTIKPSQMPSKIDGIETSSSIVNGIIEQYKAESGTIDANTFVEFVNKTTIDTIGTDTDLETGYTTATPSAIALSKNKVFIAHQRNDYLYGIVCTISGTTITLGTDTQLSTGSSSYYRASTIALNENKVFIAHADTGSSFKLNGIVCEINGTTITPGTDTTLISQNGTADVVSTVRLSENKVFIAHAFSSILNGIVCTISGTTITTGTYKKLVNNSNTAQYVSAVLVDTNKVFIAHRDSDNLNGIVCTISGTTITPGTDTLIVNGISSSNCVYQYTDAVQLNTNKVFIVHRMLDKLNGIVCEINGTTITKGTDTMIFYGNNIYENASATVLNENKVFIAHRSDNTNNYLNGIICIINGTTITPGTDTTLVSISNSYQYTSAVLININKVFIAHSKGYTNSLRGIVCISKDTIQPSSTKIEGITKEECTTSTAGDVWVLE